MKHEEYIAYDIVYYIVYDIRIIYRIRYRIRYRMQYRIRYIDLLTVNWTDRNAFLDIRCVNVDYERHRNFSITYP